MIRSNTMSHFRFSLTFSIIIAIVLCLIPAREARAGLASGMVDSGFIANTNAGGYAGAFLVLDDGKLLVGGNFSQINGIDRSSLAKLNSDGSLDGS
ncbi:MAG: hypothetical protein EHM70_13225, partial [Chloroflexota bacterium]